jgi:hypothetical protein
MLFVDVGSVELFTTSVAFVARVFEVLPFVRRQSAGCLKLFRTVFALIQLNFNRNHTLDFYDIL